MEPALDSALRAKVRLRWILTPRNLSNSRILIDLEPGTSYLRAISP